MKEEKKKIYILTQQVQALEIVDNLYLFMQVHKDIFAVLMSYWREVWAVWYIQGPDSPSPAQPCFVSSRVAHTGQDQDLAASSSGCRP